MATNWKNWQKLTVAATFAVALAGCAATGGFNGAPGSRSAEEFIDAPDAQPKDEPIIAVSTRPYTVFGKRYEPLKQRQPLVQQGQASWYGKQFHGRPTSIGEPYDMYAMTAAHPTLPLPSYIKVVNQANQRSVIVRVNDRGPFLNDRIVDLSFAAAAKLGYIEQTVTEVTLEVVDPMIVTLQAVRKRRGLEPLGISNTVASSTNSKEAAEPLTAAATLPLTTAQPETVSTPTDQTKSEPQPPVKTALAPPQTLTDNNQFQTTQSVPQPVLVSPEEKVKEPAKEEADPVQAVNLGMRQNRRIADVMIPPDVQATNAPVRFTTPPVITVEPFEGKGLRRAIPESERQRRERARKARNRLAKAREREKNKPVFVVPYKDQLPKESGEQKPPKVYLQLGAYDTEKTAQLAFVRATTSLRWMRQPVQLINDRGLHKIQAGPFASANTARKAAKRIRLGTSFSPFYVYR